MALNSRPFSPLPSPTPAPKSDDVFLFSRLSFLWITCLFGAFFLAVFGEFLRTGVFFLSGGFLAGIGITLWKFRPSRELLMWGVAFFLLAFSISFISSPTVFSGRDQGSYANAAIRLVETESLQSRSLVSDTFFSLYGPGKALNFPGFFYTSEGALTSQFPLGSIVWFGLNFSLFGVSGFSVANSLSLFFSLTGLFLLLRRFVSMPFAAAGSLSLALSFPILWISEQTLSENLALALFIILSLQLVRFLERPKCSTWITIVAAGSFLFLVRIEGIAFFLVATMLPFFFRESRLFLRERFFSLVLPSATFFLALFTLSIGVSTPFYITIVKALIESFSESRLSGNSQMNFSALSSIGTRLTLFATYGMLPVFILAFMSISLLVRRRNFLALSPLFLTLPVFFYFLSPHIASDHPWVVRRFTFSIWPIVVFLAFLGIELFFRKIKERASFPSPGVFSFCCALLLLLPGIPAIISVLPLSDSRFLSDTQLLSSRFADEDLILVDRMASGDPFSMLADPMNTLFRKEAVYFFHPEDLQKINLRPFRNTYLLVRKEEENRYREALHQTFTLEEQAPYTLNISLPSRPTNPRELPHKKNEIVNGSVFLLHPSSL